MPRNGQVCQRYVWVQVPSKAYQVYLSEVNDVKHAFLNFFAFQDDVFLEWVNGLKGELFLFLREEVENHLEGKSGFTNLALKPFCRSNVDGFVLVVSNFSSHVDPLNQAVFVDVLGRPLAFTKNPKSVVFFNGLAHAVSTGGVVLNHGKFDICLVHCISVKFFDDFWNFRHLR